MDLMLISVDFFFALFLSHDDMIKRKVFLINEFHCGTEQLRKF